MKCWNCGNERDTQDAFCTVCGAPTAPVGVQPVVATPPVYGGSAVRVAGAGCYRAVGVAALVCGVLLLLRTALSLIVVAPQIGFWPSVGVGLRGLVAPLLLLLCGGAAFALAKKPRFGAAAAFAAGTLVWLELFGFVAEWLVGNALGGEALVAWGSFYWLAKLVTVSLAVLAIVLRMLNRGPGIAALIGLAAGLAAGVVLFFLLEPLGQLLQVPPHVFGLFVPVGRVWCFALPLVGLGLGLGAWLAARNAGAYAAVLAVRLVVALLASVVGAFLLHFGLVSLPVAVIGAELIGAVLAAVLIIVTKRRIPE